MSDVGDSQADDAGIDGELVPAEDEQVVEARVLPAVADAPPATAIATRKVSLPATVAAAGGGMVLGIAAFMLLRVLRRPRAASAVSRPRRGVDIAASRSFLVDVHLLKR